MPEGGGGRIKVGCAHTPAPPDKVAEVTEEITRSNLEPNICLSQNPLSCWKINEHKFPKLAKLAKWMMCILATSVPSERVLALGGDILSAQ